MSSNYDVTNNPQYLALQQSYQDQLDTVSNIQALQERLTTATNDAQTNPDANAKAADLQQIKDIQQQIHNLDPGGKLTNPDGTFKDANIQQDLTAQEQDALNTLSAVIQGQDALQQITATALSTKTDSDADLSSRCMMVMAMLGDADDSVAQGYMADMTNKVNEINELSSIAEVLRVDRPDGTDPTKTGPVSAQLINELQQMGVQVPSDITLSSDGQTYTISQADIDTALNNIQSTQSSLTMTNQDTNINMSKAIDASQQARTAESSSLEQWTQLMQKIDNNI